MSAQWEYRVQTYKLSMRGFDYERMEADLNGFGRDGWEVVSTLAPSFGAGQAIELAILLKRPAG